MEQKIGIIGGGVLGSAMKQHFAQAKVYDKFKPQDPLEKVLESDIFFICVPTPYTEGIGFDLSAIEDVFSILKDLPRKIAVIRSTVLPGTTRAMQAKYPGLKILFNPEFLTEAVAVEDFLHPDKQIVGYTETSQNVSEEVLKLLPDAPYKKIMPSGEAEMVKYMVNNYYAMKVVYANQVYDICEAAGLNYDLVKEGFSADKRVVNSHLEIFHKGSRGFGGKCLPKDLYSMIDFAKSCGVRSELLEAVKTINGFLKPDK